MPFEICQATQKGVQSSIFFYTAQAAPVLHRGLLAILAVRCDEFNFLASKGFIKRIAVIGTIPSKSSGVSHRDNFIDCSFNKFDFMRAGRIRVYGDRQTQSVSDNPEL